MIHKDRVKQILEHNTKNNGKFILYWMQQSMRIQYNHALNYAIELANKKRLPLIVWFNILPNYPEANLRHYTFMLEGLKEIQEDCCKENIHFELSIGKLTDNIKPYLEDVDTIIMDRGYLKPQRHMRNEVYKLIKDTYIIDIIQVESDLIIPVEALYPKAAYGAYVIRPKVMEKLHQYMDYKELSRLDNLSKIQIHEPLNLSNIADIVNKLPMDISVKPYHKFKGGRKEAYKHLEYFFNQLLKDYNKRSDPALHIQSYMSMYLQFGQVSDQEILRMLYDHPYYKLYPEMSEGFIEQLVVRRSLAYNFVTYIKDYDRFEYMTEAWAYETMHEHDKDIRNHIYSLDEIEFSKTHDIYFNAAMKEARITGFMANYLRMYWAKKIMEWSGSMKDAYQIIVHLNNKYFIDGRNPNSYGNIAWNFGKHDRAWQERAIFGKLRYMNEQGLIRKFDMKSYLEYVNKI